MNIYVGELPYSITEEDLKTMFTEFGKLEGVRIIQDRMTGRSKGFGFVEMADDSEADRAIKALNGKIIDGTNIKVIRAVSGAERPKRPKPFNSKRH